MVTGLLTFTYLLLLLLKAASSAFAIQQQNRHRSPDRQDFSAASILQPILSGDPLLKEQLTWNVQHLHGAEFLWLIDEDDQAAASITEEIRQAYPQAEIEVIRFAPAPESVNPKSYKLEQGWRSSTRQTCVILDDDSRLFPGTLTQMLGEVDDNTIVTALPFYEDQGDAPSKLLATFVNNNAAMTYLSLLPFQSPISINGMCYALSKTLLIRIGGYQNILRHLADDLAIAGRVRSCQGRIRQLYHPVAVRTSLNGLSQYVRQSHRWFLFATLLLANQSAVQRLLIFILHGLPPLLLWGVFALNFVHGEPIAIALALGVLAVRSALIVGLQKISSGKVRHRPLISLLSELLQPIHLCHALLWRKIVWRSRKLRVFTNERFESA